MLTNTIWIAANRERVRLRHSGANLFAKARADERRLRSVVGMADKPFSDMATIPPEIHEAVMALPPEDRHDRTKVNEAVRRYQFDRRPH